MTTHEAATVLASGSGLACY